MNNTALILIDIQNIYFEEGPFLLSHPEQAALNARKVLDFFREKNLSVIHVQHKFDTTGYKKSSSFLNLLHETVAPVSNEKIIHKEMPSSFYKTDLLEYLKEHEIKNLVIAGMMSHMCVDTTVRACCDYGFNVTLIDDACTTMDLKYGEETIPAETVHKTFMTSLEGIFAELTTAEKFIEENN